MKGGIDATSWRRVAVLQWLQGAVGLVKSEGMEVGMKTGSLQGRL